MSEAIFEGASRLVYDGTRVTCLASGSTGRAVARYLGTSVLVLFDLLVALGAWAALRKLERLRSVPAVAAQVNDAQNTLVGFGVFLVATTVVLVLLVLEQRRRWQWRRTVFDLGAGTLLDVDGARLAGLSEARISVRPYEPTAAARALGVFGLLISLAALLQGTPSVAGDKGSEVVVTWPGGTRILCEPCAFDAAEALAARLGELGLSRG